MCNQIKTKYHILSILLAMVLLFVMVIPQTVSAASKVSVTEGIYVIKSALDTSKAIDIEGGSTSNKANVQLYDSNGTGAQIFKIEKVTASGYVIKNMQSGKVLDVEGGSKASGTNVWQYYEHDGSNEKETYAQTWYFYNAGGGYYYIQSRLGCYLDVTGGKTANGTNIQVYNGNKTAAQKWKLEKASESDTWQLPVNSAYYTWGTSSNWSWGANCNDYGRSNSNGRNYHIGVDLNSKSDSNVYAAAAGTVAASGRNSANGNYVIIKHTVSGKTVYSFYAHLKSYSAKKGTSVSKGQKIGVIGNTGSAAGSVKHVHFAIVDSLSSNGGYYGYATKFSGNKTTYSGKTYYNPIYVVNNKKLP